VASGGAGCRPDRGKPVGQRRVHDAVVQPSHGRRRVEQGGRPRAGEGRGNWAARLGWAEREAVSPAAPAPFSFSFLFF